MIYLFGQRCCSCSKPKLGLHLPVRTVIFNSSGSYYYDSFLSFFFLFARQPDFPGDGESAVCVSCLSSWQSVFLVRRRASHAAQRRGDRPLKKQKTKQHFCGSLAKCGNRIVMMMVIIKGLRCWQRVLASVLDHIIGNQYQQ